MRSIKFRAWSTLENDFLSPKEWKNRVWVDGLGEIRSLSTVKLMPYTGLKDKNGKEIYEKDILDFDNRRHVVTFDNGGFGIWKDVRVDLYSNQMRKLREPLWNLVVDECEVIGNIYENPELLEESI